MRVTCKCGHKGRIGNCQLDSPESLSLESQCLNVHCGHAWVAKLEFYRTITPSALSAERLQNGPQDTLLHHVKPSALIICKCGHKGRIRDSTKHSADFVTLYCDCLDPSCGHRWVSNLTFSRTISPSALDGERLLFDRLRALPKQQVRELLDQLGVSR
ncbi:ogr/Delta-like zinc finger family protein [Pseudomonas helleri]|uniref:ogr/Delta-like zinc finger family protein n=1 Tax=Pseudomonas helleri TaxID=1608996 RepID=UPI003F96F5CE